MTIEQVKARVTQHDLETQSVHVQTTLVDHPLRLVAIGRLFLTVLSEGNVRDEWGNKSVDWWCTFCSSPSTSGSLWDRWRFANLYATGSELGMGWDMV